MIRKFHSLTSRKSLSLSLSLSHTHTPLSLTLSLSHTHTHTHTLSLSHSLSHTHTLSLSHSLTHTHSLSQYMEAAMTVGQFGYRQMNGLTFDDPSEDLRGFARIGRRELVTYTTDGDGEWGGSQGQGVRCRSYQLTRIRCWKVGYWVSAESAVCVWLCYWSTLTSGEWEEVAGIPLSPWRHKRGLCMGSSGWQGNSVPDVVYPVGG